MVSYEKAIKFHEKHPIVWKAFEHESLIAARRKQTRESAKYVFEVLRRTYKELGTTERFKLNNDYSAFYARMFAEKYPQYANLYEYRDSKYDNKPDSGQLKLEL